MTAIMLALLLAPTVPGGAAASKDAAELYAEGHVKEALAAYRRRLARNPDDRTAQLAVARIQAELARRHAQALPRTPRRAAEEEKTWLSRAAAWVHFDRTLGGLLFRLGTQEAMRGRVEQLLAEQRTAKAKRRMFHRDKELELRALVRRLPAVLGEEREVYI